MNFNEGLSKLMMESDHPDAELWDVEFSKGHDDYAFLEKVWNLAQEQLLKEMYPLRDFNKESDNASN